MVNQKANLSIDRYWLIALFFWIILLCLIIALGRIKLISLSYFMLIAFVSLSISYLIDRYMLVGGISNILPDKADIVSEVWIAIALFIVSLLNNLSSSDNRDRENEYFKHTALKFMKKYRLEQDFLTDRQVIQMALAIIVKENFERPKVVRYFESFVGAKTTNIAQNGTEIDEQSIKKLIKFIRISKQKYEKFSVAKQTEYTNLEFYVFTKYNSESYANDVWIIYSALDDLKARGVTNAT